MAIEVVGNWMSDHGLSLAAEKIEAVLIVRTKKRVYATFTVNDEKIKMKDTMKPRSHNRRADVVQRPP